MKVLEGLKSVSGLKICKSYLLSLVYILFLAFHLNMDKLFTRLDGITVVNELEKTNILNIFTYTTLTMDTKVMMPIQNECPILDRHEYSGLFGVQTSDNFKNMCTVWIIAIK